VLQCVAVCCSVLQCVAVCCSVLQCVAVCGSVWSCVAVCCSVWQFVLLSQASIGWRRCKGCLKLLFIVSGSVVESVRPPRGSVLQCVAVCCSVLQCVAVCCRVRQCVLLSQASMKRRRCEGYLKLLSTVTGWRRPIGCLVFRGHFLQMSTRISGSLVKNNCNLRHSIGLRLPLVDLLRKA